MSSNIYWAKLWHHNRIYCVSIKDNTLTEQTTVTRDSSYKRKYRLLCNNSCRFCSSRWTFWMELMPIWLLFLAFPEVWVLKQTSHKICQACRTWAWHLWSFSLLFGVLDKVIHIPTYPKVTAQMHSIYRILKSHLFLLSLSLIWIYWGRVALWDVHKWTPMVRTDHFEICGSCCDFYSPFHCLHGWVN